MANIEATEKKYTDLSMMKHRTIRSGNDKTFTASLPILTRVLEPGDVMTLEYNSERVNIHVNEDSVCTLVSVG